MQDSNGRRKYDRQFKEEAIVLIDPSGHRWKWLDRQMDRLRENERFQTVVGGGLQLLGGPFFVPGSALLTQSKTGRMILGAEVIITAAIVGCYAGCTLQLTSAAAPGGASVYGMLCFGSGCGGVPLSYIGAALFGGGAASGLSSGGGSSADQSPGSENISATPVIMIPCPGGDCSYMMEHQSDILIGGPMAIVIDELIAGSQMIKATNSLIQYERSGGFSEALRWFKALATDYGAVVEESSKTRGVYFFKTPSGIEGEVRSFSTYGTPTIEIHQPGVSEIKFRFQE